MELRQIRYFLAVADARSFVSAANALYISRQAISKSIAQLEEELNVELFMRDSSGAFLTPAGVMFYDRVRAIVMDLDNIRSQMQAYGTRYHQRIRIAFSIGTMSLLEQTLLAYRENQHNADITYEEYSEEECKQRLLEHNADIVISTEAIQDPLFVTEELIHSPMGILIRQQENLQDISINDLSWIPIAGQNDMQIKDFCTKHGVALRYRGYDYHRLFTLTVEGKCALLLPACLVPRQMEGLQWLPMHKGGDWHLYVTHARSVEKNLLYSAALDDLQQHVFSPMKQSMEDKV